jgi:glycerol-3-phosphate acyltransferase PlsY
LAAVVFPLAALLRHHEPLTPLMNAVVILLPLIVIAKHHANIRRLLAGTEYRFGKSKAAAA